MAEESPLIVSVSGIRGIVGRSLTPEVASSFAAALGTATRGGTIVVSRDGRPSGDMLRHAVIAGLRSTGCEVYDVGIKPTPTCGLAVRRLQAAGGVQITASHNPAEWNGLKLFDGDGRVLSPDDGRRIQDLFERQAFTRKPWNQLGSLRESFEATTWHCEQVLKCLGLNAFEQSLKCEPPNVASADARIVPGLAFENMGENWGATNPIGKRRPHVFLDANGGAGGPLGQKLLELLECKVTAHACGADGNFRHEPEPTAANLTAIGPLVARAQADVGFVLDPDADRLALIDEKGRYIGEELTLALAAVFRLRQEKGPVVVNMSTSRLIEDIAREAGCPVYRSAVGEANVADRMLAVSAVFGGEGNGGVIDPRIGYVRDPFIGMALILNLMAATRKKLSELVAELPAYTIVKDKYTVGRAGLPKLFAALQQRWPEATPSTLDGLRLDWPDRWVHVRPSNTEPIVRVIAEAPQAADAECLCREVGQLLG